MQRIYVDVTELLANALHTGIQRVVRRIAREGLEQSASLGIELFPVVALRDRFYPLSQMGREQLLAQASPKPGARVTVDSVSARIGKAILRPVPPLYAWVQSKYFNRRILKRLNGIHATTPLSFTDKDTVVLLDSFWGGSTALQAARRARREGAKVAAVVYDMIPVSHPQFCDVLLAKSFPQFITGAIEICSGILTISEYSKNVVEQFAARLGYDLPIRHFYLGYDLDTSAPSIESHSNWPQKLWNGDGRVHLTVGTIEPRKRHATILEAFEKLWVRGYTGKLLIIGKIGWKVEDFMSRCENHPELNNKLFLVHGANDAMLAEAFRRSDAGIIASAVEGFGLPLVESLSTGLPMIATDIKVFREIAGDSALYFTLDDAESLATAVLEMEADKKNLREATRKFRWIDWHEALRQFVIAVNDVTRSKHECTK